MNKPKEPTKPWPPSPSEYAERVEKRYIYSYTESLHEEEEDVAEEKELPKKPIGEVDLAWLHGEIPVGVNPGQVKIEFGFNASAMSHDDHYVRFYYEETVPARTADFDAAFDVYKAKKARYDEALAAYINDLNAYEIWETEQRLQKLKGELPGEIH